MRNLDYFEILSDYFEKVSHYEVKNLLFLLSHWQKGVSIATSTIKQNPELCRPPPQRVTKEHQTGPTQDTANNTTRHKGNLIRFPAKQY